MKKHSPHTNEFVEKAKLYAFGAALVFGLLFAWAVLLAPAFIDIFAPHLQSQFDCLLRARC